VALPLEKYRVSNVTPLRIGSVGPWMPCVAEVNKKTEPENSPLPEYLTMFPLLSIHMGIFTLPFDIRTQVKVPVLIFELSHPTNPVKDENIAYFHYTGMEYWL
jgi:hypothetical protein